MLLRNARRLLLPLTALVAVGALGACAVYRTDYYGYYTYPNGSYAYSPSVVYP